VYKRQILDRYKEAFEAEGIYDKIPTENEVKTVDELMPWLEEHQHPWIMGEVELPE